MRYLAGWMGVLWLVAGCTVPKDIGRPCDSNADCDKGECSVHGYCVAVVEIPDDGGTCPFTCAEYEACTSSGCRRRFTGLAIVAPADNSLFDGGTVQVEAQLEPNAALTSIPRYPNELLFSATLSDGGTAGSFRTVSRTDGRYTAEWTAPSGDEHITLTAEHPLPDAELSDVVSVRVDTLPPTFTVSLSSPPSRVTGSNGQADQWDLTPGYEGAFRRDEAVTVTVSADEPVTNVALTVIGVGPGGVAGRAESPVMVQPTSTCVGNPAFCGSTTVELSRPELSDFRGILGLQVSGVDGAGHHGLASTGVKVTRWKWVFDAPDIITSTPAVGNRGTVYLGTAGTSGRLVAIEPDGTRRWEATTGQLSGGLAVGVLSGNEEYVYFAAKSSLASGLYAFRSNGTEKIKCTQTAAVDLPSAIAVGTVGGLESAVTIYHGSPQRRITQVRPGAAVGIECLEIVGTGIPLSVSGGAVVIKDTNLFYGTTEPGLTSYDLAVDSNAPRSGWPQRTHSPARGLALLRDTIYGGASNADNPSLGSLFAAPVTGGTAGGVVPILYPEGNTSRVFNLSIGGGNVAYFGAETSTVRELVALTVDSPLATPVKASNVGTLRGAPVVGRNQRLYTVNTEGRVAAWATSDLTQQWSVDLPQPPGSVDVSPTLDCRRDANGNAMAGPGTLYVTARNTVYAFIVDSPGMDPNAPWPKYQHDARNTGNPATPITNCP